MSGMEYGDINVSKVDVTFGDARLSFCNLTVGKDKNVNLENMETKYQYHSHLYFECHIITAGTAYYRNLETQIAVERGQILIIPPHTEHCPIEALEYDDTTSQTPIMARDLCIMLMLESAEGESGYYSYFYDSLQSVGCVPFEMPRLLLEKFIIFMDYYKNPSLRERCFQKATAYDIITALFDLINGFRSTDQRLAEQKTSKDKTVILDYLVNDLHCPLYVIAEKLGYSVRHTARLILQTYGQNLIDYRQKIMLDNAKRLLVQFPELSLEKIALDAGFSDEEAMRRTFMKWEKCTPLEYRKQNGKAEVQPDTSDKKISP